MNSINNKPFRNSNINMENNNILNNTSPKMKKIDKFEQPIAKNFLNKIKEEIEKAIKKYGSNTQEMKQVAEALNIGIATLYRKVKKYNIK